MTVLGAPGKEQGASRGISTVREADMREVGVSLHCQCRGMYIYTLDEHFSLTSTLTSAQMTADKMR